MHSADPAKRIPKSLGTDPKLFGTYTLTDAAVAAFPAIVVVLGTQLLVPPSTTVAGVAVQSLTLPVAGLATVAGAIFVYLTPSYTSSVEWLLTFVDYTASADRLAHEAASGVTQIERVYPRREAIERTDGAMVGMVAVEPPTMALATDAEWQAKAAAFRDFLNTTVEFPIQLFSTTREFPVDEYVAHYEARLEDADVEANQQLARLIEHYVEWYRDELDQRPTTIRSHYVIVSVTPSEVQFERESFLEQLAALPYLGVFVEAWFAPRLAEQRAAQFDALSDRLHRVESGLREIEGCDARRVPVEDAVLVLSAFWHGEAVTYDDVSSVLRTRPLVASGGAYL